MTLAAFFLFLSGPFAAQEISFDPVQEARLPIELQWSIYSPDWVVLASDKPLEKISLRSGDTTVLAQLKPKEAFRLQQAAFERGSKKTLVPAGALLVRAPGPLNAACEMLRQPGFERRTCLVDNDLDGMFENFFRRIDTSILLMVPAQSSKFYRKLSIKELDGRLAYRPLDEDTDIKPVRFLLKYNRVEQKASGESDNYLSVCIEPYDPKIPQGKEHFGRDCLNSGGLFKDRQIPKSFQVFGTLVSLNSVENNAMWVTIKRPQQSSQTKLLYEQR